MKSHKYWSLGALFCMLGCIYSGIKKSMTAHKYFAYSSLLCMGMSIYSGHKLVSPKKKKSLNQIIVRIVKQKNFLYSSKTKLLENFFLQQLSSYRKPQAMLVEEKSRSVETVEKEPPFAIIRSG